MNQFSRQANILLILPAFNEQDALPPLLAACEKTRQQLPNLQVLVVNDGSKDNTAQVVSDYAQQHHWVQLVNHPRNLGLAAAMRTGITTALQQVPAGGLIASMDGDNTHQPHELQGMLDKLNSGLDLVIASRFRKGAKMAGIPWNRQLFSIGVSILFQVFAPIAGVRDYSCGYRLYRATALQRLQDEWGERMITEQGFACMTEILLKLSLLDGMKFGETPMDLRYDWKPTASKMNVARNIREMFALMWRHRLKATFRKN
jgi:dolichol-phosphate mannosyltransferase